MKDSKTKSFHFFDTVRYNTEAGTENFQDRITVEEPLEVRIRYTDGSDKTVSVIMRTPSLDNYLAVGFLYSEGIIKNKNQVMSISNTDPEGTALENIVIVHVTEGVHFDLSDYGRNFAINSSCGVCGKSSINDIFVRSGKLIRSTSKIDAGTLLKLPDLMRRQQRIFGETGGIHAAGLFDNKGNLKVVAEDIGRHNAVDKVIGYMVLNDLLFQDDLVLQVSGRAGFEILQKAAMAGIPVVSSVSAPSTLAINTAESMNMTLVCFVRGDRFNIYTNPSRIRT